MVTKSKLPLTYKVDERKPLAELSRIKVVQYKPGGSVRALYGYRDHFSVFVEHYVATVLGDKMFYKKSGSEQLTLKDNKMYGNITFGIANTIIEVFNLNWIDDACKTILKGDKKLWLMILKGTITNPEQLFKRYSKMYFKGVYSFRNLKRATKTGINLWTLYHYSDNPEYMLERTLNGEFDDIQQFDGDGMRDIFMCCSILNTKVSSRWSIRRLREVHQEQIDQVNLLRADELSNEQIDAPFSDGNLSLILDERSMFIEGYHMHNCVYSCYWFDVARGDYLIASGIVEGTKVDLGIRVIRDADDTKLEFNQVVKFKNDPVSPTVKAYCEYWILKNADALKAIADRIKAKKVKVNHGWF